jgi:hypothetical protein
VSLDVATDGLHPDQAAWLQRCSGMKSGITCRRPCIVAVATQWQTRLQRCKLHLSELVMTLDVA